MTKRRPHRPRSRAEAGNAMLELVLLLPLYMFILLLVVVLGEYGRLQTHCQIVGRYLCWQLPPATTEQTRLEFFEHLGERITVSDADRGYQELVPDTASGNANSGKLSASSVKATGGRTLTGVHAWKDETLADPLHGPAGTIRSLYTVQGMGLPWSPTAKGQLDGVASIALDGDIAKDGGFNKIPWLQRQHASVVVRYRPSGWLGFDLWAHTFQTVLRAKTYGTGDHDPYKPSPSGVLLTLHRDLREIEAWAVPTPRALANQDPEGLKFAHQLDSLRTPTFLDASIQGTAP